MPSARSNSITESGNASTASPIIADLMEGAPDFPAQLRASFMALHRKLSAIVRNDAVCRQPMPMTIPGVEPVVSLGFRQHYRRHSSLQKLRNRSHKRNMSTGHRVG
jgi:hypothetical protein